MVGLHRADAQAQGRRRARRLRMRMRGSTYPIDRTEVEDDRLDDLDTSAAHDDWTEHIGTVDHQTVPLPTASPRSWISWRRS
ncbi:hypothetical protein [Streptomyces sp. NPDC048639]|uniref:hypothetical protein n=1 Tax=Streptomyces sp. NPDC048639 TaxID=3365581 RepID=UPI00370FDB22